jgi:hypothetical protein
MDGDSNQRAEIRRLLSWALVFSLCIAALTAIAAITSGSFDDTDGRVIGTSAGFALFSAIGASGAQLRYRTAEALRTLGLVTIVLAALSFVLLVVALWEGLYSDDGWEAFGCSALAALAASHASIMAGSRRPDDSDAVAGLSAASIGLGAFDAFTGILLITESVEFEEGTAQMLAVMVVLLVLTTVLTPIVRRIQRPAPGASPAAPSSSPPTSAPAEASLTLASEVLVIADRIEALNADPSRRSPEIRRECERLRALARARAG